MLLSDYHILKVTSAASKYHMKRWFNDRKIESYKHFITACDKHLEFFWSLFEHLTDIPRAKFQCNYAGSMECAIEEMEANHNIIIQNNTNYYYYLIPKTNTDLMKWVNDNKGDIPVKELKRIRIILQFHQPTTRLRSKLKLSTDWYAKLYEK